MPRPNVSNNNRPMVAAVLDEHNIRFLTGTQRARDVQAGDAVGRLGARNPRSDLPRVIPR